MKILLDYKFYNAHFCDNKLIFMKNIGHILIYILFFTPAIAQKSKQLERPKLVVGLVIDQMRWDYLYRYYDRFGDDGFKRLLSEGFNCQNTQINYIPTATGPGHASIYSGSIPAIHGVAANGWVDRKTGKEWYCVEDPTVSSVGGSARGGMMSPRNMKTTTIGDELRLATNMRSKVFGVGIKDRGSILPAGHTANGAFWFDDSTGNFITSTYYMNELPVWLNQFNNNSYAKQLAGQAWETLYDISTYKSSIADDNMYEGLLKGESKPVFPHVIKCNEKVGYKALRYVPAGNTITFKLAEACIKGEQLGSDDFTDMLCITLSSTDYAGHNYAPDAVEMEDMYLRLDQEIAAFLKKLDKLVGQNKYTLFLTADHGVSRNANYLKNLKIPAGTETEYSAGKELNSFLIERHKVSGLVKALSSYQVYFDEEKIKESKLDRSQIKADVVSFLYEHEGVAKVIDLEDLNMQTIPEPIRKMIVNSYYPKRNGSLLILMEPSWYSGYGETGTTHGTWNPYDSHVPLLWYGWGVSKGESYRTIDLTDVATTVAALLHIQMPNGNIGHVIEEVIKK